MQQQLEDTLAKLIAIPSASANTDACREIAEFVRGELEPLGLHITADIHSQHPWVMATTLATKAPKTLLVAHLDVVPAVDDRQYELRKEKDRLYGRGVWDMKYAAAVYLEFLKAHEDVLHDLDLGVLFTTDEEIGGYQGVAQVLREGWRTELAIIPDYGDDWRIEEGAKGIYGTKLCAMGKSAHGSTPWKGENAAQKLIPVLHELQTLYPSDDPLGPTLSINMLSGGQAMNQLPDEVCAWLDFRAFSEEEIAHHKTTLSRLAEEYGLSVEETVTGHPLTLDKEHPLVKQFMQSMAESGIKPVYEKSFGATDGRWFAAHDIPCIITGPHGKNAHGASEWIRRQDLLMFYDILDHFIKNNARFRASSKPA